MEGFAAVDGVLTNALKSVTNVLLNDIKMNIDFADIKAAMSDSGWVLCVMALQLAQIGQQKQSAML